MKKLNQLLLVALSLWAFTSCTNEIEGTENIIDNEEKFELSVSFESQMDTRVTYDYVLGAGLIATWEAGDQIVAYNKLGIKVGSFLIDTGVGQNTARFKINKSFLLPGDYTFIYVPDDGIVKNTLIQQRAYIHGLILKQTGNDDAYHLRYGMQIEGEFSYKIGDEIATSQIKHKLGSFAVTLVPPTEEVKDEEIISLVVWNGLKRQEIKMNNIAWDQNILAHILIHPHEACERTITCFVNTVGKKNNSVVKTYKFTRTTNKEHKAGKNYTLNANNFSPFDL